MGYGKARSIAASNLTVLIVLVHQGYVLAINGIAAPWIMSGFGLDQSGLARLFAWISLSSVGALIVSRLFDRYGRLPILRWCVIAASLGSVGAAMSRSLLLFATCEITAEAAASAAIAGSIVILAEGLAIGDRAMGQSLGGVALGAGSGLCIVLMPLLAYGGFSWRWLLVIAGAPLLGLPFAVTAFGPRSAWRPASTAVNVAIADLLRSRYRLRAIVFMVSAMFSTIAITSAKTWSYFHSVSVVGLNPAAASAMLLVAGGLALVGFPLGALSCERLGRVPTVCLFAVMLSVTIAWSFWGPPLDASHPIIWLGIGFCGFGLATNAATVGGNSSSTELFPPAMRATMIGCIMFAGSLGRVAGQGIIALLASSLGGVSPVVGCLGLLGVAVAAIFGWFVEESRGLPLEVAAAK